MSTTLKAVVLADPQIVAEQSRVCQQQHTHYVKSSQTFKHTHTHNRTHARVHIQKAMENET